MSAWSRSYWDILLIHQLWKEVFYLTTHSTHFIYGCMASDMIKNHSDRERWNPPLPHRLLFWLAARVLLYASSHRQDNTYHGLCYTSHGALSGTIFLRVLICFLVFVFTVSIHDSIRLAMTLPLEVPQSGVSLHHRSLTSETESSSRKGNKKTVVLNLKLVVKTCARMSTNAQNKFL